MPKRQTKLKPQAVGRLGGLARKAALTPTQRTAIAGKAAQARWRAMTPEERSAYGRRRVLVRWAKARARGKGTKESK